MVEHDPLAEAMNQFKDVGISQDEYDMLLQRAITSRIRVDESTWLRDKPTAFYYGMLAAWRIYSSLHRSHGIVLRDKVTGKLFDDELGDEISIVIKSLT